MLLNWGCWGCWIGRRTWRSSHVSRLAPPLSWRICQTRVMRSFSSESSWRSSSSELTLALAGRGLNRSFWKLQATRVYLPNLPMSIAYDLCFQSWLISSNWLTSLVPMPNSYQSHLTEPTKLTFLKLSNPLLIAFQPATCHRFYTSWLPS